MVMALSHNFVFEFRFVLNNDLEKVKIRQCVNEPLDVEFHSNFFIGNFQFVTIIRCELLIKK